MIFFIRWEGGDFCFSGALIKLKDLEKKDNGITRPVKFNCPSLVLAFFCSAYIRGEKEVLIIYLF